MMPRVLICASTLTHINNFHLPYIRFFKDRGYEVHIAARGSEKPEAADVMHDLPITKSFFSADNIRAALKLGKIIRKYRFDLILTHTALAGAVGRLAVSLAGKGSAKVIHTVHGYLFWNGCGLLKRLIYGFPERLFRNITDCIITMNEEDAVTALKLVKRGGLVRKVPGMGVDASRFYPPSASERAEARRKYSIPKNAFVIVYAAEFSARKNHIELVKALPKLASEIPDLQLLLCGTGALKDYIGSEIQKLGLSGKVRFMGWRSDMDGIYRAADMSVSTAVSEGLPFNIVEAQLCGLPVAASRIRGHTDLIEPDVTGLLYPPGEPDALAGAVLEIYRSGDRGEALGMAASGEAVRYSLDEAFLENTGIYGLYMADRSAGNTVPAFQNK